MTFLENELNGTEGVIRCTAVVGLEATTDHCTGLEPDSVPGNGTRASGAVVASCGAALVSGVPVTSLVSVASIAKLASVVFALSVVPELKLN